MSYDKEHYQKYKKQHDAFMNKYRKKNLDKYRGCQKKWVECNRDKHNENSRKYYQSHKEEILEQGKKRLKEFREKNPIVYIYRGWDTIRKKVLERDKYICQICGVKANEVHHKDGSGSNNPTKEQNNKLDNLITLCHKCHMNEDLKLWNGGFAKGKWKEEKERNAEILSLVGRKSLIEIGKMFNISRQRVHQLINK